ncbi:DUF542 domain-containing protein [Pseudoalteromonas sp. MT33b]|uniref:DUF542 domain-containing protein n=1 Tax=Pseudoalteromonas sp. MT33b TaxID=2759705 RepID=UPI0015F8E928|nr:DUF542 domain-containing protein [Pseudoalteromonas sp. MT33b]QMW14737.1 DUF542 domain-containing protein [Pseudoalteromonas sp. MT33b]
MNYLNWPISKIATEIPGATALFFAHRINFCCQGHLVLSDVIEKRNIDREEIISDIEVLLSRQTAIDYHNLSNKELVEHILTRYHRVHRVQLEELIRLSERVEEVHFDKPNCPNGLANHLKNMYVELEDHMQKEELFLFPMLQADTIPDMVSGPISVMMADHEAHIAEIEKIYQLTNDVTLHAGACNTWTALYLGLQAFISDLNMHIHIENAILFARVEGR